MIDQLRNEADAAGKQAVAEAKDRLKGFEPAAAGKAADRLRELAASRAPAGLLDRMGGQQFLDGMPSNLVSRLTPMLKDLTESERARIVERAASALRDPKTLDRFMDELPNKDALMEELLGALPASDAADRLKQLVQDPQNLEQLMDELPNKDALMKELLGDLPASDAADRLKQLVQDPQDLERLIDELPNKDALMKELLGDRLKQLVKGELPAYLADHPEVPAAAKEDAAKLVRELRNQARSAYEDAVRKMPRPPVPRVVPEKLLREQMPEAVDLFKAGSCSQAVADMARANEPELAKQLEEGMAEVMAAAADRPAILQEAAGLMSLLGGPEAVPIRDVTDGLEALAEEYSGKLKGLPPQRDLMEAIKRMPLPALEGLASQAPE